MTRKPGKSTPSTARGNADALLRDADASQPESLLDLPEGYMPADSGEADELLASFADEQINRLSLEERDARENIEADEAETGFAELTPEEAAALRAGEDDPPPPITQDSPEDDTVTSMPTDDELDALLRGEDSSAPQGRQLEVEPEFPDDQDALSAAAAELAAELDSQPENALAGPPARPAKAAAGREVADDDLDSVNADDAVEARKGINAVEPPAVTAEEPAPAGQPAPGSVPWFFKPLIWLNAPLAGAPEPVRDMIGKIALITILNAVAVFVYVFIVRR